MKAIRSFKGQVGDQGNGTLRFWTTHFGSLKKRESAKPLASPLQIPCTSLAKPLQTPCKALAKPLQNLCKALAKAFQKPCKTHAKPYKHLAKPASAAIKNTYRDAP